MRNHVGSFEPFQEPLALSASLDDRRSWSYRNFKRLMDLVLCALLFPFLVAALIFALVLNPFFNPGPLFFLQKRMGRGCRPFYLIKLRTMRPTSGSFRQPWDPLETDRISRLGGFYRKTRMDELPQILNVLKGEMSIIGPRPDAYEHAAHFVKTIPGYDTRHCVCPGISGLAQTQLGYAEGTDETRAKVMADHAYIQNASIGLDLWLLWQTVVTVVLARGN